MKKKVSLKDVAARVGVSATLVSYVLNNKEKKGRVGKEMAQKIRKAAREMNYQPNLIARGLKSGSTKTIGLIVADISNPFYSNLARIIENEAREFGYTVIFGSSDEDVEKFYDLINAFLNRQVDGLIVAPVENAEARMKQLLKNQIPFVQIDRYIPLLKANSVSVDNYAATYNAVEHLIKNGYKKPGMIAYESTLAHLNQRLKGFEDAVIANKIKPNIEKVKVINTEDSVKKALDNLIIKKKVDSLLFANISLTTRSLYHIDKYEKKVPQELGLISYDQSDVFDFFHSPLTYIRQDLNSLGKCAVNILIQELNMGQSKPVNQIVATELVVRNSSTR